MAKTPAFQFYPGDWLRDDVAGCSLAAQGLWLRMMIVMHSSERYGYLCVNGVPIPPESTARRCGTTLDEYTTLLTELDNAGVPSRTDDGIIYSRRMVRDEKARRKFSAYGKKGGNPLLKPRVNPPPNPSLKGKGKIEDLPEKRPGEEGVAIVRKPTQAERIAAAAAGNPYPARTT